MKLKIKDIFTGNKGGIAVIGISFIVILAIIIGARVLNDNTVYAEDIPEAQPSNMLNAEELANDEAAKVTTTTTPPPAVTTTSPITTTTPLPTTTTAPATTTTPPPILNEGESTLAPVEVITELEQFFIEEFDTEIEDTPPPAQTTPAPGMPEGAQGTDSAGNIYKVENGQKYVWDPILGWGTTSGQGGTIIMDVVDHGDREQYDGGW